MRDPVHIISGKTRLILLVHGRIKHAQLTARHICHGPPCILPVIGDVRHAAPAPVHSFEFFFPVKTSVRLPELYQALYMKEQRIVCLEPAPVHPGSLVVLAVDVIISLLRIIKFISGQDTGSSLRRKQERERILHLVFPQRHDRLFPARPLRAAVPAVIKIRSVLISLPVRLIVFSVIGYQIP